MPERGGDASEANEAQQETTREPRVMHRQAPGFSRQAKSISIFLAAVACQLALVSNYFGFFSRSCVRDDVLQHVAMRLNRVAQWMHVNAPGYPRRQTISTVMRADR